VKSASEKGVRATLSAATTPVVQASESASTPLRICLGILPLYGVSRVLNAVPTAHVLDRKAMHAPFLELLHMLGGRATALEGWARGIRR
jgi:hypothetical protein